MKLALKNFPLSMHPMAPKAAIAALAAARQDKYWEYSHKLFESSASLSEDKFRTIAQELKLNMEKFRSDMNDPALQQLVQRDLNEAMQAEVPGTPTLFVNGRHVQFRSLEDIDQAIEQAISRSKAASAGQKQP